MPTEIKRLTAIPDADALSVLGYSVEEDGPTGCVVGPSRRLARLVGHAARELDAVLARPEWNAVADVMNGCADLYDYADTDVPALLLVRANLQDSPGIAEKWNLDLPELLDKLAALTPLHGEAILCAVRWFWRNTEAGIDHTAEDWWQPAFRLLRSRKEREA